MESHHFRFAGSHFQNQFSQEREREQREGRKKRKNCGEKRKIFNRFSIVCITAFLLDPESFGQQQQQPGLILWGEGERERRWLGGGEVRIKIDCDENK